MIKNIFMFVCLNILKYLKSEVGALAAGTGMASWDITKGSRVDFNLLLAKMLEEDPGILGRIGVGENALAAEHKWVQRKLTALEVEGSGSLSAVAVTLNVTAGHGLRVRVGSLLKDWARNKSEVVQVTAISTDALTITRGYGTTSGETHADDAIWKIISQPRQEGQDAGVGGVKDSTEEGNYTQIFQRDLKISGSSQAISKGGTLIGIPDMEKIGIYENTIDLKKELEFMVINGIKSASAGSDSVYRTSSGIIEMLDVTDGNRSSIAADLSYKIINDMCRDILDDGGKPNLIVVGTALHAAVSGWEFEKITRVASDRQRGAFVTSVITDTGEVLELMHTEGVPPDVLLMLDTNRISLKPLINRTWAWEPLAKTGDAVKSQMVGEYTLELQHAKHAHAIRRNLN